MAEKNMNEIYFEWWAKELQGVGLVLEIESQPKRFILEDAIPIFYKHKYKTKDPIYKDFTLFNPITYTCDYRIVFSGKMVNKLVGVFFDDNQLLDDPNQKTGNNYQNTLFYVHESKIKLIEGTNKIHSVELFFDVKPPAIASKFSGRLGSSRDFKFNQRMTYNKHKIYVNKVVPADGKNCLFNKTFIPKRYNYTDGGSMIRKRKKHLDYSKTLKNYINSKQIL